MLSEIQNEVGVLLTSREDINKEVVKFFSSLLNFDLVSSSHVNSEVLDVIPSVVHKIRTICYSSQLSWRN